ncbi:MAG TPA: holo-ACP synthase [Firmicutes bacterium]|jgi:holo-[acyl-carrier protein] synthase|nr:holo-ACP synthase [Bacillota bacterium]
MIIGNGVDIIEIKRINKVLGRYGDRYLERLLTPAEQEQWRQRGSRLETLAGYWAAKEAVAKALGSGFRGFGLQDIQVTHDPLGRPLVVLSGEAQTLAVQAGITHIWLSISHSLEYAVATAIAEGRTS